jgi:hypothetical protein
MTLSASLDRRQDINLGAGYRLNVTGEVEGHGGQLEFYATKSTARYQGLNLKIELTGISSVHSDDDGLHLGAESQAGQVDLIIDRRGIVRLGIVPPIGPHDLPTDATSSPADESPPTAYSGAPRQQSEIAGKEKSGTTASIATPALA